MIEKCPVCKEQSYVKRPEGRLMREFFGLSFTIATQYKWQCLNKECKYISEIITEKENMKIITEKEK